MNSIQRKIFQSTHSMKSETVGVLIGVYQTSISIHSLNEE